MKKKRSRRVTELKSPDGGRTSIADLEKILNSEEEVALQIRPDGSVWAGGAPSKRKPLTMKEKLGGEYAV